VVPTPPAGRVLPIRRSPSGPSPDREWMLSRQIAIFGRRGPPLPPVACLRGGAAGSSTPEGRSRIQGGTLGDNRRSRLTHSTDIELAHRAADGRPARSSRFAVPSIDLSIDEHPSPSRPPIRASEDHRAIGCDHEPRAPPAGISSQPARPTISANVQPPPSTDARPTPQHPRACIWVVSPTRQPTRRRARPPNRTRTQFGRLRSAAPAFRAERGPGDRIVA
jgi:hypothetical protein